MTSDQDRITKLEEEVTHLARTNEELSSELAGQWKRMEVIEKKFLHLETRFASVEDSLEQPAENTKPPHW